MLCYNVAILYIYIYIYMYIALLCLIALFCAWPYRTHGAHAAGEQVEDGAEPLACLQQTWETSLPREFLGEP